MTYQSTLFKALSLFLIITIIFSDLPPAMSALVPAAVQATSGDFLRGDITGDGVVDGRDALKIMRIVEGLDSATPEEITRGDVHPLPGTDGRLMGDGQLTQDDAEKILRGEVELIPQGEVTGDFSESPPTIDGFFPAHGPIGTQVTIGGTNFVAASPEENQALFGDIPASVLDSTGTELVVGVPAGAETGRLRVITPGGDAVSPFNFTVTVERAGVLVPPAGISPTDYGLINKFGEVVEAGADGAFSNNVDVQGVTTQFAVPLDDSDRMLLSVEVGTGWGAQGETAFQGEAHMDLLSTAQALVFLSPYFMTSQPENAQVHMTYIRDDPEVAELAQVLEQLYQETPQPFDDPRFEEAYKAATQSVIDRLPENFTLDLGQAGTQMTSHQVRRFQVLGTEGGGQPQVFELTADSDGVRDVADWQLSSRRVYYPDRKETIAGDSTQIGGIPPEAVPGNPVDWFVDMAPVKDIYDTFPQGIDDIVLADPLRVLPRTDDHQFGVIDAKSYAKYIDLFGVVYEEYFWKPAAEMVTDAIPDLEGWASPDGDMHVATDDQGKPVDAVYVVRVYSGQLPILDGPELAESDFATVALQEAGYDGYWFNVGALGWNAVMAAIDIWSLWIDPTSACSIGEGLTGSHGRKLRLVLRKILQTGGKKGLKVALKRAPKAGTRVSTGEGWKVTWSILYDLGKDFTTVMAGDCLGESGKLLARKAASALGVVGKILEWLYRISLGAQAADRIAALVGLNPLSDVTPLETWIVVIGQPFTPTVEKVLPEEAAPGEEVTLEGKSFDYRAAQNNEVRLGDTWETARQVEVLQVGPDGKTLTFRVPDDQPEGQVDIWIKTSYTFHGLPVKQDTPLRVKRIPRLRELSPDFGFAPVPAGAEGPFAGYAGTEVILMGTGLTPSPGAPADKVFFGTTQAQVLTVGRVRVPNVPPGQTKVYIDSPEHGVQTQRLPFTVLDKPQLTSVTPASAKPGHVLTLKGSNFKEDFTRVTVGGRNAPIWDVMTDTIAAQMPTVGEPGDHLNVQVWNPAGPSASHSIVREAGLEVPDPAIPPEEKEFPPGYYIKVGDADPGSSPDGKVSFDEANSFINGTDPFSPPYDDLDAVYEWTWIEKIIPGSCHEVDGKQVCACYELEDEPDTKSGPLYSYHKGEYNFNFDGARGHPGTEREVIMRINDLRPGCHGGEGGATDPVLFINGSQDAPEPDWDEEVNCEEGYVADDCPEEGDFVRYRTGSDRNGGQGYADLIEFDLGVESYHGNSFQPDDGDTLTGLGNLILSGSITIQNANQVRASGIERVAGITIVGDGKERGALNRVSADTLGGGGIRLIKAVANRVEVNEIRNAAIGVDIAQCLGNYVGVHGPISNVAGDGVRIISSVGSTVDSGWIESPGRYGAYIKGGGSNHIGVGVRSSGSTAVYLKETVGSGAAAQVEGAGGRGFEIEGGGLNSVGGSVDGAGGDGVRVTNSSENGVSVMVSNCSGYGVALLDVRDHTIRAGATGCGNSGLYIQGGGEHEVTRFDAETNGGHGIELNGTVHNTLDHITSVGNQGNGLHLSNGTSFTDFDTFRGGEDEGIWNNQNGIVIEGPTTYHNNVGNAGVRFRFYEDDEYIGNRQNGIVIQNGTHDNAVYGAYGNNQNGVVVRGGAHDNTIYLGVTGNGQHGVLVEDAHDNTITEWQISSEFNKVSGNGADGIRIGPNAADNTVEGDLVIYGNGGNGITVLGDGTLIDGWRGMEIGQTSPYTPLPNQGFGILVDGAVGTWIETVEAGRNEKGGIRVENVRQDVATASEAGPLMSIFGRVGYEKILNDQRVFSHYQGIDGLQGYGVYFDNSTDVRCGVRVYGHQVGLHIGGEDPARFTCLSGGVVSSTEDGIELLNLRDSDLTLYASNNGGDGISLVNGRDIRFDGAVSLYRPNGDENGGSGISIEDSEHITIGYGLFYRNQEHGVYIGPGSRYVDLLGVVAFDNQDSGVYVKQAADVALLSARRETTGFMRNQEAGIAIEDTETVRLLSALPDERIHSNGIGIDVRGQDSNDILISGWAIDDNREAGIRVEGATNVLIGGFSSEEGNSIVFNKNGIVASGPDTQVVIANNHIWRNQHLALPGGVDWRQPDSVHGMNPAEATAEMAGVGVALYNDINGAMIQGNQIDANQTHGILLTDRAQTNVIRENTITGNGGAGIRVEGPNTAFNTITMNPITNNQGKGIELANGGNGEIEPPVIEKLAWRSYNIAGRAIGAPAGSRVEVYADTADEGERLVGVSTVYGERFYVRADPSAGFTPNMLAGLQLHAIVIHPSGNTSEFGPTELKAQRDRMVFTSTRDGNPSTGSGQGREIYLLYPWQDQPSRLTDHAAADHSPRLSPDGDRVLFVSDRSGNPDIWMLGADGSSPTQLTRDVSAEYDPAWSPDGSQMAFVSEREGNPAIYTIGLGPDGPAGELAYDDGVAEFGHGAPNGHAYGVHFTQQPTAQVADASAKPLTAIRFWIDADPAEFQWQIYDWVNGQPGPLIAEGQTTPETTGWHSVGLTGVEVGEDFLVGMRYIGDDQLKLGFDFREEASDRSWLDTGEGWWRLPAPDFIMIRADFAAGAVQVTDDAFTNRHPAWSPDGTKIAFTSDRGGSLDIWLMNADGTGLQQLTSSPAPDYKPAWSPDGTQIAFVSERDGNSEIYLTDADGTNSTRLTDHTATDTDPTWKRDGARILFSSDRGSGMEIYAMRPDGSGMRRLTTSLGDNTQPDTGPPGSSPAVGSMSIAETLAGAPSVEAGAGERVVSHLRPVAIHLAAETQAAPVQVAVQSANALPGETFTVPVTVAGAQSLGYLAFDIAYDPIKLTLLEATPAEFSDGGLFTLNPDAYPSASGLIRFSWVSAAGFSGDGTVVNLTFQVETDAEPGEIPVSFQNPGASDVALGDTPVASQDGQVTVTCAGDVTTTFVTAEPGGSVNLVARLTNAGGAQVPPGLSVAFYLGDPDIDGELIGTAATTQALGPGASEDVTVTWNADNPGDHTITIVANDDGTGTGPLALCSAPAPVQQTVSILDVPLVESWNLMSSYVHPFTTDVSVVQRSIAGQYVVIQSFDGGALSYYPDLPPEVNTLKEMDAGHGYWIKAVSGQQLAVSSEQLAVSGQQLAVSSEQSPDAAEGVVATLRVVGGKLAEDRPLNLEAGWNLVSYLPRQPLPVADALQSIAGQYFAVLGFDQGALSYYADLDPVFNTLKTMEPLHGYWIKMNQAGTLQYPVASNQLSVNSEQSSVDSDRSSLNTDHWSLITDHLSITPTSTWVNFYGPAHWPDGTPLPVGTTMEVVDPDGIVCGAAVVTHAGQYGLLACYGDDPTTPEDEGAQAGDTVRLVVDGQELGTAVWTAHGERQWVPLGPAPVWRVWLPLLRR